MAKMHYISNCCCTKKMRQYHSTVYSRFGDTYHRASARAGFRGARVGPGPQASHQQRVSHQTPQFLKPCNSIANPFLKSQIHHWAQASHQLNPALASAKQF